MGISSWSECSLLYVWLLAMAMALVRSQTSYDPPDAYFIKCGATVDASYENRVWKGDLAISDLLSSSPADSIAASSDNSSIGLLFNTSRIFTKTGIYRFKVSPGRHWVRLYLYPFAQQNFNPSSASFSVLAGAFTLLYNYKPAADRIISSPSIYGADSGFVVKEYNINVTENSLEISFIPSSTSSYALINAMEVVSTPPGLFIDSVSPLMNKSASSIGLPSMALETMHRVNVGGPLIAGDNDTAGLYRTWSANESNFIGEADSTQELKADLSAIIYGAGTSQLIAPPIVYSTALQANITNAEKPEGVNLTWTFPVVAEYTYLVRLHFCELVYGTGLQRVFNVYLQNQTAYTRLDLGLRFPARYTVLYIDFSLTLSTDTSLWVQAGPPPDSDAQQEYEAIVNGIEIWKLNNLQSSLDGSSAGLPSSDSKPNSALVVGCAAGAAAAVVLVIIGICFFCRQRAKVVKQPTASWVPLPMHAGQSISLVSKTTVASGAGSYASSAQSSMGRVFTFSEILEAIHNFDEALMIGVGGFGKVYQGELDDGTTVAVKRGNPRSEQGLMEFQTEIEMLSKVRHRHLVSLIGYCKENQEMVLVYEFMANGPLRSHLYGCDLPPLSWRQRLEICVGAARGLHYLHTGATQSIIHRDLKTTNILLDDNLVAKVSDFGLSKTGPSLDQTHVSTAVKGSFGYLDPEYFRTQHLTEKSDVYSFGVVLMEVLCARPAINPTLPRDQVNIAEWAMHWQCKGMLDQIIDPHLVGSISMESLAKFGETAEKCLAEVGASRPPIGQVLWNLEYCLQLQDASVARGIPTENADRISELPILPPVQEAWEESMAMNQSFIENDDDQEDATMSAVFSRMVRPNGK